MKTKKAPLPKTKGFAFDEAKHVYTLDGKPLMGVTSVLSVVAKPALIQWAANEAIAHIKTKGAKYAEITKAFIGYEVTDELLEEARTAHAKKRVTAADAGTDLHAKVEEYVNLMIRDQDGIPHDMNIEDNPIQKFIDWAKQENIRFIASEHQMYSKEFSIAGTADLVFEKDGKLYIGDVKTYKKIWDRLPFIQCAAYGLMWDEMHPVELEPDFTNPHKIDGYCIIRIKDDEFETMWSYDSKGDTEAFLAALKLYTHLKNFIS